MQKRWLLRDVKDAATDAQLDGIHSLLVAILHARGIIEPDQIRRFLNPALADICDPALMSGMAAAVARILQARRSGEKIVIYGDYDVDGITSVALLVSFMRKTGFCCDYFIPNRFDDGYGLNMAALQQIIAAGAGLIISVDCGITALEEACFCRDKGVDLIITDHHSPKDELPDACAVLNPHQPGCAYPFKQLAGVGVAFNLMIAIRAGLRGEQDYSRSSEPDLREWLDLVALGTIADVVPLLGVNRILASTGLRQLSSSSRPGVASLKEVAGISGDVSCGQVGFRLAPRLNAAGRVESAVPGVELLLGDDSTACLAIARDLDSANAERQSIERGILDEAIRMVEESGDYPARRSIVLASRSWHQGVIGIVASRLVERYHRPTILIAIGEDGVAKGSGRSIAGFHLLDAIAASAAALDRFGGHRYAAGVGLQADAITAFAAEFEAAAAAVLGEDDLVPTLNIDLELTPDAVTLELAQELKRLEPFGASNPEPVLFMRGLKVQERRIVGDSHLRLRLSKDGSAFTAIAFGMADRVFGDVVDLAFYPEINEWKGNFSLQLKVKDLRDVE